MRGKMRRDKIFFRDSKGKVNDFDWKDKEILKQLCIDSNMTFAEISRNTEIPIDTIKYRVKKWELSKLIKFQLDVSTKKLGFDINVMLLVRFVNLSEYEHLVRDFIKRNRNMVSCSNLSGDYDFQINIIARNIEEYHKVLSDFKTEFDGVIRSINTNFVLNDYSDSAKLLIGG